MPAGVSGSICCTAVCFSLPAGGIRLLMSISSDWSNSTPWWINLQPAKSEWLSLLVSHKPSTILSYYKTNSGDFSLQSVLRNEEGRDFFLPHTVRKHVPDIPTERWWSMGQLLQRSAPVSVYKAPWAIKLEFISDTVGLLCSLHEHWCLNNLQDHKDT